MAGLFGAAVSAVGNIVAGKARKKAAKNASQEIDRKAAETTASVYQIVNEADVRNMQRRDADVAELRRLLAGDQDRAVALARADEKRLAGMSGVDFGKLVADATAAGFNPLTALQFAGTAAYERARSFIASPFIGQAAAFIGRPLADATLVASSIMQGGADRAQASREIAGTAGYFGDALAGFGQNLVGISQEHARLRSDALLAAALERPAPQQVPGVVGRVVPVDARPPRMTLPAAPASSGGLGLNPWSPVTPLMVGGVQVQVDDTWSDAEIAEARYGDVGGSIYGMGTLWADYRKTVAARDAALDAQMRASPLYVEPIETTVLPGSKGLARFWGKGGPEGPDIYWYDPDPFRVPG